MARVLFVTDQWGYGTTTSAISIAAALEGSDARWLIGEGAGFTLARPVSFDDHIPADTMRSCPPEALKEAIRESDVVVSVMNPNAAAVADKLSVPCVYVDTLLWMWARPPVLPSSVKRYFAAGFPGVKQNAFQWRDRLPRTEFVAPLIARTRPRDCRGQMDVLVNFGGLSSLLTPQGPLRTYAGAMVGCIIEALADWPGQITISMGEHILNPMERALLRVTRSDVRFVNLSHYEYLEELERSRVLVSSPGLSATQEAFARGIPCLLLPSQNLSQALTVRTLDRAGAAFALDWEAIYGLTGLSAEDEPRSCQRIADCIGRFQRDDRARARLVSHLTAQLMPDRLERIAAAQVAFFEPNQERSGAHEVANYVRHLVSPTSPRLSAPDLPLTLLEIEETARGRSSPPPPRGARGGIYELASPSQFGPAGSPPLAADIFHAGSGHPDRLDGRLHLRSNQVDLRGVESSRSVVLDLALHKILPVGGGRKKASAPGSEAELATTGVVASTSD